MQWYTLDQDFVSVTVVQGFLNHGWRPQGGDMWFRKLESKNKIFRAVRDSMLNIMIDKHDIFFEKH